VKVLEGYLLNNCKCKNNGNKKVNVEVGCLQKGATCTQEKRSANDGSMQQLVQLRTKKWFQGAARGSVEGSDLLPCLGH
jgi:hypothetical protein